MQKMTLQITRQSTVTNVILPWALKSEDLSE